MQSGGGGGGPAWNPGVGPAGRTASTSSAASPSSSSSSVQQQQQQIASRQQQLRKSEGNDAALAFQSGGIQGMLGGGNFASSPGSMQLPQQSRKFFELPQKQGSLQEGQQGLNPVHQAYLQYALQAQQQKAALASQQQARMGMLGSTMGKDQDARVGMLNMQEFISMQGAGQAQTSSSKMSSEQFARGEKQLEQGSDQRNDSKPLPQQMGSGQLMPAHVLRPMLAPQAQQSVHNMGNNSLALAQQWQAMQAWALDRNIDLSHPANANQMAQILQARIAAQQKSNEGNVSAQPSSIPVSRQPTTSSLVPGENSPHANSLSDISGQSVAAKARQSISASPFGPTSTPRNGNPVMHLFSTQGRDNLVHPRQSVLPSNGLPPGDYPQKSANVALAVDLHPSAKKPVGCPETLQMQQLRQPPSNSAAPSDTVSVNSSSLQGGLTQQAQQRFGFTKQQLHVLKAQILAFRRLKKGEGTLPQELLQAIAPPPLELQPQHQIPPSEGSNQDRSKTGEGLARHSESAKESQAASSANGQIFSKEEDNVGDTKAAVAGGQNQAFLKREKEAASAAAVAKEEQQTEIFPVKSDQGADLGAQRSPSRSDSMADKGKAVAPPAAVYDGQAKKPSQASTPQQTKDTASARKYHGPLFDFPFFTRKHDAYGSATANANNNLTLAYDIKDLLVEEGAEFLKKKRKERLKKIKGLLAKNLERKRIRPDLVLRLQIEEKKLRLVDLQSRLRDEVDQQQQEIMSMPDRPYRKFVRLCERQRLEMARQVNANQKAAREKQLKSIFQWRKKLLEAHWAIRDARTARNRGVAKYHEKMLREFSKRKDDDRNKRMEALKNNDVERYREMLLEQQTNMPGDAAERYAVLSSFLTQTEDYLHKLGSKITAAKNQQEVEEAASAAAAAARLQGLSEEEVRAAATCAREEVMIRNRFMEMNAPKDSSSVSKYYSLAHAVNETVIRQPSMLKAGTLRDYQLVGLQWMLSLYNNKLNGILADEMGLGKTVQVMALIAYLMEFKGNYGPHLIIVPNAVLVNWKSEFYNWLPSVSCIFYVGAKDQRAKLFSEVCAMKFNVLVTTYEFIMYDRTKLSRVDWKYIIIDEAQRMKDRESVLARDLDRYRCHRRLLLTGTPLQNDLKELWSLLNLLLPEVFDNRKAFHDWFSQPFQKEGPAHNAEDDWLETEKKVIIIHRLHQILEPFMLRRRVEDVEGSLPPKVSIVLRCRMSAIQSAIYDWIKATGTLRVDPEDEKRRSLKNPIYQIKTYRPLNNRCMELRKACNHPLLNYPYFNDLSKDFLVRSCGKLWILDRILIKLHRTGHRVLLFSTMTKLLDILEEYLQWRRLVYRRIDGTTSLEDRESAIVDFNDPDTDCFIFLLSIRAAGRGLNLQAADTVVIYDPDPNPKNEEQAVARAHRIGQTREVKVIYMEAVVDKISSHQKEDELRSGGSIDLEDDLAGKDRYMGSIESLIRNNIQQYKIDMADEVINAGRFDQRTTHEERRMTLETLLHDEERYQETLHDVPSLNEVNRMIARSEEEVVLFDQMDEELDWTEEMTCHERVPKWLRASTREVNAAVADLSRKPSKNILFNANAGVQLVAVESEVKRGRPKGKKINYKEIEDENEGYSEASSDERNAYSVNEEEGEIGVFEDDESAGPSDAQQNKDESDDEAPVCGSGYNYPRDSENAKTNNTLDEAVFSGSSSESRRSKPIVSPVSPQKFGSLSALDSRPGSSAKRIVDDLEEGEIAASGDSFVDRQQSGSWALDRDEGEEEQVLQPKIKRKRSIRLRPRTMERLEEKFSSDLPSAQHGEASQTPLQVDRGYRTKLRTGIESHGPRQDASDPSSKLRRSLPARRVANTSKLHSSPNSSRLNNMQLPVEDGTETADGRSVSPIGPTSSAPRMSEIIQRRCKNVISRLQRRISKEGQQIVPMLTNLWKKVQNGYKPGGGNNLLDLREIDRRLESLEYTGVLELASDVQFMLKGAMQFYGFTHEVRSEARKVHNLFFDLLKMAFPDTNFREARSALSFSGPVPTSASVPSPRQASISQAKRQKLINEVEAEPSSPQRPPQRENTRIRVQIPQKETRLSSTSQAEEPPMLAHPGELVICKKKRKDREKSVMKTRAGGSNSPITPPAMVGRGLRSPAPGAAPKETRLAQQATQQQRLGLHPNSSGAGGETVGWAKPVKRLRTDAGKRRPSHL